MAIAVTHLTSSYDNVDRTNYDTASISPTANRWLVIDVFQGSTLDLTAPTITGLVGGSSLTFVQEASLSYGGATRRLTRFYAWTGAAPGTGTIDINFTLGQIGCAWIVYEISGADETDPFVQSATAAGGGAATSVAVTLAAFASSDNRPLIVAHHAVNEGVAHDTTPSAYTEIAPSDLAGAAPAVGMNTAYNSTDTDTTPSYSWATSTGTSAAVASEIKAGAATQTLGMSGIASAEAFGSPGLTPGSATASPGAIASAEVFGAVDLAAGSITVTPDGVVGAEAVGSPELALGSVELVPDGIVSGEAVPDPSVSTVGEVVLVPQGIESAEAFGVAVLSPGLVQIEPVSIDSGETFGTPAMTPGTIVLLTGAIASEEAFPNPALLIGPIQLDIVGIVSLEAFGIPTIIAPSFLDLTGIPSAESFGIPIFGFLPLIKQPTSLILSNNGRVIYVVSLAHTALEPTLTSTDLEITS